MRTKEIIFNKSKKDILGRNAANIINRLQEFKSDIYAHVYDHPHDVEPSHVCNLKSLISFLSFNIKQGDKIMIFVFEKNGENPKEVLEKVVAILLEDNKPSE